MFSKVTKVLWTPLWPRPVFDAQLKLLASCGSTYRGAGSQTGLSASPWCWQTLQTIISPLGHKVSPADIYKVSPLCSQSATACKCTDCISLKYIYRRQDVCSLKSTPLSCDLQQRETAVIGSCAALPDRTGRPTLRRRGDESWWIKTEARWNLRARLSRCSVKWK